MQAEHPLFRVVRENDEAGVERLLAGDPSVVDVRGHMGATPLYEAASAGSLPMVRLLLRAGAGARARRDAGDTALHRAATAEIAELLIGAAREIGCDPRSDLQQTPLHTARTGEVAAVLLRHRASLDARDGAGRTARSIDADVTGRRTPLGMAGSPMGYFTTPGVTADGGTIAIGLDEIVVLLDMADGRPRAIRPVTGTANTILTSTNGGLLAATDHGWQDV